MTACLKGIQKRADKAYKLFEADSNHPGLNFEQREHDPVRYSAQITIHYRALCTRKGDTYVWFWIGHHTEYDKLIKIAKDRSLLAIRSTGCLVRTKNIPES